MLTATPFLMFEGSARAAMDLYVGTLPGSSITRVETYPPGAPNAGSVVVATFSLCGREFMCSDSPIRHDFSFTPASSIFLTFDSAEELERVFGVLSEGGQVLMPLDDYGFSPKFGWLNDRFGVSWQLNLAA